MIQLFKPQQTLDGDTTAVEQVRHAGKPRSIQLPGTGLALLLKHQRLVPAASVRRMPRRLPALA